MASKLNTLKIVLLQLVMLTFAVYFGLELKNIASNANYNKELIHALNKISIEKIESNHSLCNKLKERTKVKMSFSAISEQYEVFHQLILGFIEKKEIDKYEFEQIKQDVFKTTANYHYRTGDQFLTTIFKFNSDELISYKLATLDQQLIKSWANKLSGYSSCGFYLTKYFADYEKSGNEYHFYPLNQHENFPRFTLKVNGKLIYKPIKWRPTRKGIHKFEIEYID